MINGRISSPRHRPAWIDLSVLSGDQRKAAMSGVYVMRGADDRPHGKGVDRRFPASRTAAYRRAWDVCRIVRS